jgi:hypothetical protein
MTEMATAQLITSKTKISLCLLAACGLTLFVLANLHLVYVAMISQPPCVAHLRQGEANKLHDTFTAAQSSCTAPMGLPGGIKR